MIVCPIVSAAGFAGGAEEMVRARAAPARRRRLVELVIVVLAGVDEHVIGRLSSAAITRDRRMISGPRADDGHHLEAGHRS